MDVRRGVEWAFGQVLSPFERFLRRTSAGGIILIATTLGAIVLATIFGDAAFEAIRELPLALSLGSAAFSMPLANWVNDALMAIFFLLVGLELKREVLVGELSSLRDSALPVAAALGGMLVPAAIYAAFNAGTPYARGWGIPMATDIAFAVGVLVLLGRRVPRTLIVFMTALAIADDLGAVLVIAIFYTAQLDAAAAAGAGIVLAMLVALNLGGIRHPLPYALLAVPLWHYVHASGVHATIAGILLAAAVPARGDENPLERWHHRLTPWVTFVIIPLFALANAGIDAGTLRPGAVAASTVAVGVVAGLVLGKFIGIAAFSAGAVALGIARLPEGVSWRQLLGAAWLGGIGFTMSIFIANLAFADAHLVEQAKIGILTASAISAAIGLAWLWLAAPRRG